MRAIKLRPQVVMAGAPEWMTTFADMMSLLLTFFILLFSMSEVQSKKVYRLGQSFDRYFNVDVPYHGHSPRPVPLDRLPELLKGLSTPEDKTGKLGRSLAAAEMEVIDRFASLSKVQSRSRIVIKGMALFQPGTAVISEEAKPTLLRVAARLNRGGDRIKVLGHTSTRPLGPEAAAFDHDELAYRRAQAVGKFLAGQEEDLGALARRLFPYEDRLTMDMGPVDPARFIYASRSYHSPVGEGNLWEEPERNDRVELVFLPEVLSAAKPLSSASTEE